MRAVDTVFEYRTQQISALHENAMVTKDKKETRKRTIRSVDQPCLPFLVSIAALDHFTIAVERFDEPTESHDAAFESTPTLSRQVYD